MAGDKVGSIYIDFVARVAEIDKTFKAASSSLKSTGKEITNIGKDIATSIGAPLALLGGLAIKAASDIEDAFVGLDQSFSGTRKQLDDTKKSIIEFSKQLPHSVQEISKVTEAGAKLGLVGDDLNKFTKDVLTFAEASSQSTEEATKQLVTLAQQTKLPISALSNLSSALIYLGDNFDAEAQDVISFSRSFANVATNLGFTQTEILGLSGGLIKLGVDADKGGSAVNKMFIAIASAVATGGDKLVAFAKIAGESASDFANQFRTAPAQALEAFLTGLGNLSKSGVNTVKALNDIGLGGGKVAGTMLQLAAGAGTVSAAIDGTTKAYEENTAAQEDADKKLSALSSKLLIVQNNVKVLAAQFGDALKPAIIDIAAAIKNFTEFFSKLSPTTKTVIADISLAIVSFSLLAVTTGTVIKAIASLAPVVALAFKAFTLLVNVVGGALVEALLFLLTPMGLVTAALVAAAAATVYWWDDIVAFVGDVKIKWETFLFDLKKATIDTVAQITQIFADLANTPLIGDTFSSAAISLNELNGKLVDSAKASATYVAALRVEQQQQKENDAQKDKSSSVTEKLKQGLAKVGETMTGVAKDVLPQYTHGLDGSSTSTQNVTKDTQNLISQIDELKKKTEQIDLTKSLSVALSANDIPEFNKLHDALSQSIEDATYEGLIKGIDQSDTTALAKAKELAKLKADEEIKQIEGPIFEARQREADQLRDLQKQALKDSVDFWRSAFENAITGTTFNLKDALKQVAVGFAAQLAAAFTGGIGIFTGDLKDLGGTIASQLVGAFSGSGVSSAISGAVSSGISGGTGGILSSIGGIFGAGTGGAAAAGAVQGPLTQAGATLAGLGLSNSTALALGDALTSLTSTLGPIAAIAGGVNIAQNFGHLSAGQGALSGAGVGLGIGTLVGGPIGGLVGAGIGGLGGALLGSIDQSFNSGKSKSQKQRDAFRKQLQDAGVLDSNFNLALTSGGQFNLGAEKIGGVNVATQAASPLAQQATGLTSGLGSIFGGGNQQLSQDITAMLANAVTGFGDATTQVSSFNAALINTQGLMDKLNLTAQQGKDQLTQLFLDGKVNLEDFGKGIQGFNLIAQNDLVGTGSVNDALNVLAANLGPDGSPRNALKGLELAFHEASELGQDQLGILKTYIAEKFGPDAAAAFDKLKELGITSFTDFNNLSSDQLYALFSVISSFTSSSISSFSDLQGSLGDTAGAADGLAKSIDGLHSKDITITTWFNNVGDSSASSSSSSSPSSGSSSGGSSSSGTSPFHKPGTIHKSAKGNIFTGPGISVFGEAGPEAVLPLARLGNGKLGVLTGANGGGHQVSINIDARGAAPGVETRIQNVLMNVRNEAAAAAVATVQDIMRRERF